MQFPVYICLYVHKHVYLFKRWVIISMVVICYASNSIEYSETTPELPNAALRHETRQRQYREFRVLRSFIRTSMF